MQAPTVTPVFYSQYSAMFFDSDQPDGLAVLLSCTTPSSPKMCELRARYEADHRVDNGSVTMNSVDKVGVKN